MVNRRFVILGGIGLASTLCVDNVATSTPSCITGFFKKECPYSMIGSWYSENFPDDLDCRSFGLRISRLLATESCSKDWRDSDSLRVYMQQSSDHDLRTGNTILIGGWIVTRSEARFCAYLASA